MNPRLSSAPLTAEDWWIWGFLYHFAQVDAQFAASLYCHGIESDRRDADLMLQAKLSRLGRWGWIRHEDTDQWFGGPLLSSQEIIEPQRIT